MNFLKDMLREHKIVELDAEIEAFMESNGLTETAIVHTIVMGKERFKTEDEAREFLKSKYFWDYNITENEDSFFAVAVSDKQIVSSNVTVSLGREATGLVGELKEVPKCQELLFNDKGEINLSSKFDSVDLSEGVPFIIEIARVAEGTHPSYGELKITEDHLLSFKDNFKSGVTGVDLSVNEDHKKNEAFGWFKDVFLSFDGQTLYGQVAWNTKGTTALSEKEYRYFSPEFRFNYKHPLTGAEHGPTLLGGALTNYPFLKMSAIVELNNKQPEGTIVEKTIELSVHESKVVELSEKITEVEGKLDVANEKNVELSAKVQKLEEEKQLSEKKAVHEKLFTAGKINKAQLIALNEGKDQLEVLGLAGKMHTEADGGNGAPEKTVELNAKEKETCKNLGISEEDYIKYNS